MNSNILMRQGRHRGQRQSYLEPTGIRIIFRNSVVTRSNKQRHGQTAFQRNVFCRSRAKIDLCKKTLVNGGIAGTGRW